MVSRKQQAKVQEQALSIMHEIGDLMREYTHDSPRPKFYLPQEIAESLMVMAGVLTQMSYKPRVKSPDVYILEAFGMFYLSITYGVRVHLKEYSIKSEGSPFSYQTDQKVLLSLVQSISDKAMEKELVATHLSDTIFDLYIKNFRKSIVLSEFLVENHTFKKRKFFDYLRFSLSWGYNFATGIIIPQ